MKIVVAGWLLDVIFLVIIFLTNIVQAISGFAGTALAMPFSISVVGVEFARPVLNLVSLALCVGIVIRNFKHIEWKYALFLISFMAIGMVGGVFAEPYLKDPLFLKLYGLGVCLVAVIFFLRPDPPKLPVWIQIIILIAAGFIHGIFVSGGPLLIIAVRTRKQNKETFRATVSFLWVILNSALLTHQAITMQFTLEMLWVILAAIPTVIGALFIGKWLFKKMRDNHFMDFTCLLLFISGFTLLF